MPQRANDVPNYTPFMSFSELRAHAVKRDAELHDRDKRIRELEAEAEDQAKALLNKDLEAASLREELAAVRAELEGYEAAFTDANAGLEAAIEQRDVAVKALKNIRLNEGRLAVAMADRALKQINADDGEGDDNGKN